MRGKVQRPFRAAERRWDHPRICGEKWDKLPSETKQKGSPPRMRGKGACNQAVCPDNGITPAYAGKRAPYTPTSSTPRDHPRVCGEKFGLPSHTFRWVGSPPHMRGKGRDGRLHPALLGITPAYAGKSPARPGPRPWRWDHPRICGEKFPNIHVPVCRSGSSPHMRGKDCGVADMVLPVRITPAYAGKSSGPTRKSGTNGDHPRVCGEKLSHVCSA